MRREDARIVLTVEFWNATWTFLTLVVLSCTGLAALMQLRHMRSYNQIQALLAVEHEFRTPAVQRALQAVQFEFRERMQDAAYRADLTALGYIDPAQHPEMDVCNWFDYVGTLVKNGLLEEPPFMELFGRLVERYWTLLVPAIALLRRERGPTQYQNFEFLVARAHRWQQRYPSGRYPKGTPRLAVVDPYLEAARVPEAN